MKLSIIGTVGVPASYGGFETLVENLIGDKMTDWQVAIYCSSKNYDSKLSHHKGARLHYIPLKANGIQSTLYDIFSISHSLFNNNNQLLILGVSGCVFLPLIQRSTKAITIVNIDGIEWKREKWNRLARAFLKLSEYCAIKYSDTTITDNQAITEYARKEYSTPTTTIEYGGDHATKDLDESGQKQGYALTLCRIEPENNCHLILEAFSATSKRLNFVGNWDSSEYGRNLKRRFSEFKNIQIIDPIYNEKKLQRLRQGATLYIHGHSAGGTNPSLVEMMFFDLPIICYDCSFNRVTTENLASYFKSVDELVSLISVNNQTNTQPMRSLAKEKYSWSIIREKYKKTILATKKRKQGVIL